VKDAKVRAVPVNSLVRFAGEELSQEQLETALDRLTADERRWFNGHLLAHEVVPLDVVNRFTAYAAEAKGEAVKAFAHRAGRFGAQQGIKTVYKFLLMVMSPAAVLKKAPLMWGRIYDTGTVSIESTSSSARIFIRDFPSHVAGCARVTGWFEVVGEGSGAKNLKVTHTTCIAEGAKECIWDAVWEE